MKASEAIARAVAAEIGDAPVFALIGDANLRLVGSLDRDAQARLCFARDEGAAVAMADGYAQASGALGVASVTSGPGLTHTATSLLAAARMRTPLVVLAGDTPMRAATGLQAMMNIDQRRFADACETEFQGLRDAASLADDIARAFDRARTGRRPVLLNAPLDLQTMDMAPGWAYAAAATGTQAPRRPSGDAIAEVATLIGRSARPLILAGRGALWAAARDALEELGAKIGALLGTTLLAKGFFGDSAWAVGVVGGYGRPAAMSLVREADLVLAFGAELGHFTTQAGSLFQGRRVVRVDIDAGSAELPPHIGLEADAREAALALCAALGDRTRTGFRDSRTRERLATPWPDEPPAAADGLIDPRALMRDLGAALPDGAHVVVGGGHFWSFPCLYLDPPRGGRYFCPLGAAAVGQTLPFAIGVAHAEPRAPVVAVEGDGSLLMNIQELDTAARHRLPLALVVMNDGALSAEAIRLGIEGYNAGLAVYPSPDFAAVAHGFGWRAETISGGADIGALLRAHRWRHGPLLIDARITRSVVVDPVAVKDLSRTKVQPSS
jgi:thiamine pyrophosphate-dependent acetolactate synthase large subunit-like protein